MAILPFLALGLLLAVDAFHVVAGESVLGPEAPERGGEEVVRDRFEGDVVAVVDEPDAGDAPPTAHIGWDRDLPARGDLHGGHGVHHIDAV
jgi:hypothetical protein